MSKEASKQENKLTVDPKQFHAATIARIKEARLESIHKKIIEEEIDKKESTLHRSKWKEKVKEKRSTEIIDLVNRQLIKDTIPELDGNLLKSKRRLNFMEEKAKTEQSLNCLVSDLNTSDDHDSLNLKRDSGGFTVKLGNGNAPSFEFLSVEGKNRSSFAYVACIATFDLLVSKRLRHLDFFESYNIPSQLNSPLGNSMNRRHHHHQLSTQSLLLSSPISKERKEISNDGQIRSLVEELVTLDYQIPGNNNLNTSTNNTTNASSSSSSSSSRKYIGFMEEVMNAITHSTKVTERTLERKNSILSGGSGTDQQQLSRKNSMLMSNIPDFHSDRTDLIGLCDGYYITGPARSTLIENMKLNLIDNSDQRRLSGFKFKPFTVDAKVLATNYVNEMPQEMIHMLPLYSFPR
jgi:hypothetical protein